MASRNCFEAVTDIGAPLPSAAPRRLRIQMRAVLGATDAPAKSLEAAARWWVGPVDRIGEPPCAPVRGTRATPLMKSGKAVSHLSAVAPRLAAWGNPHVILATRSAQTTLWADQGQRARSSANRRTDNCGPTAWEVVAAIDHRRSARHTLGTATCARRSSLKSK